MFHSFLVRDQSPGVIMALNRHRFRERRLSGSLSTTLDDRRWPVVAAGGPNRYTLVCGETGSSRSNITGKRPNNMKYFIGSK